MTPPATTTDKPITLVGRILLGLSVAIYFLYSSFGIAAPFWWGHHGYHGATYMLRARSSLRFHLLSPVTWTGFDLPPANSYYFHHPIGYHHILTALIPVFGEQEWLARVVAVLGGALALWAIYGLARRVWSPDAGAIAVAAFVSLPIITSFSVLSDPMLLEMACVVWSLSSYFDLIRQPSHRALRRAALAYFLGGLLMWEVFFIGPFIAAHAFVFSATSRGRALRLGRYNALWLHIFATGAACVMAMAFHVWLTHHSGAWGEFLESYRVRHSPPSALYVIDRHSAWLDILYGRVPLLFGGAWLMLFIVRALSGAARLSDLVPLTFFYVNTLYIYMFAEGSSVHLYRVFFYSGFFCFAVADLSVDAARAWRHTISPRKGSAIVMFGTFALFFGLIARHTLHNLVESREMMGTHGQPGYSPHQEKMRFAAEIRSATSPTDRIVVHQSLQVRKEFWFYLDRSTDEVPTLAKFRELISDGRPRALLIADVAALGGQDLAIWRELLAKHSVTFYDNFAAVDLRSSAPSARSFSFVTEPAGLLYRWFVSHKFPPQHLERISAFPSLCSAIDVGAPIATDEQLPAKLPNSQCAYNYLISRGEAARAEAVRKQLLARYTPRDLRVGDLRLIASRVTGKRASFIYTTDADVVLPTRRYVQGAAQVAHDPSPGARLRAAQLYTDDVDLPAVSPSGDVTISLWRGKESLGEASLDVSKP